VAELAKRVEALEVGAKFEATQKDVKEVEKEFLAKLQEIRETIVKDAGGTSSSKDMQALKEENDALKKRNAKLEYRVQHLVKTMEELYAKSKQ
jgi:predicted  nucleic acid-binding Zn-ribbon protein